ncbi:MAG: VanW family protein [Candidatus Magasanikbacteria bacterium]|nr:VanW family protein [Candidatus Magasanikbacteria bacterium]
MSLDFLEEKKEKKALWKAPTRFLLLVFGLPMVIIILGATALAVYGASFRGEVLPGVFIGDAPLAGLNRGEVVAFLSDMNDKLANEGLRFSYQVDGRQETAVIYPEVVDDSVLPDAVEMNVEKEADNLIGKDRNLLSWGVSALLSGWGETKYKLRTVRVDETRLLEKIKNKISIYESLPQNAEIKIKSIDPLQYEILPAKAGVVFDYGGAIMEVKRLWSDLQPAQVFITNKNEQPKIFENDVKSIENRLPSVFVHGPISLSYQDPHTGLKSDWQISLGQIADWVEAQKTADGGLAFGLEQNSVVDFLIKKVQPNVDVEAQDAKFKIGADGKMEEFQGSRPGVKLDMEKTYSAINEALIERTRHDEGVATAVAVVVEKVEPNIKTGDVNNLGIKEILGVGVSNYSGSPKNRIKNIANAVKKLNGILVKPGEIFSAIQYTQPFTLDGGYLPELVIKGDEIKPEIGGGLCQIGTTLFRMAMNAGMEIIERRNHSLVVSYYNDPSNGNPGTDATFYDPKPDFRFRNDTANYVLIQTEMNTVTGELRFYLWGTSDGRKGFYSKPVVKRWIPYGEPKEIETTKLEPGKKECQHAYRGADTSFAYTREFSNGREKEETVYESHYRALPQICLVGVEEKAEEPAEIVENNVGVSEAGDQVGNGE